MTSLTISIWLLAASSAVIFILGLAHLTFTFVGNKLHPSDAAVIDAMKASSLVLTRETTMWNAWTGFNASHSFGALLFGLVFGYFAVVAPSQFFSSLYLRGIGLAMLLGYVYVAHRFWFSSPFRGILIATVLYVLALVTS